MRIGMFINNNVVLIHSGVFKSAGTGTFSTYPIICRIELTCSVIHTALMWGKKHHQLYKGLHFNY